MLLLRLFLICCLLFTPMYCAEPLIKPENPAEAPMVNHLLNSDHPHRDSFFAEFLSMMIVLSMTLAGMVIIAWILKRFLNRRMQDANLTSTIKILEQRMLGHKSALYVIEIEGIKILIGETPGGLSRLGEIPSSERQPFSRFLDKSPNSESTGSK